MGKSAIEVLMNPLRIRIFMLVQNNGQMTTLEIRKILNDVPQATLYRHINTLVKSGLLKIVKENKIRGAIERVYEASLGNQEGIPSKEDMMDIGYNFFFSMILEYDKYLKEKDSDPIKDLLTLGKAPLYQTDDEYKEMIMDIGKVIEKHIKNEPAEGRKLRTMYNISIPYVE